LAGKLQKVGDKAIYEDGAFADSSYVDLLKIPFLKGSRTGVVVIVFQPEC